MMPENHHRNRLAVRLLQTMQALTTQRLTLDELARLGGVTTRTVRRDLAALEETYLPLLKDGDYYRLERR